MRNKNLLKDIESVKVPTRFDMTVGELNAIYEAYGDMAERMMAAFSYGFLKGQRAAARKNGVR